MWFRSNYLQSRILTLESENDLLRHSAASSNVKAARLEAQVEGLERLIAFMQEKTTTAPPQPPHSVQLASFDPTPDLTANIQDFRAYLEHQGKLDAGLEKETNS